MGNSVCARPLAAPSGFARTLLRLCFAKLLASLVGGPDGFAAGASRAQATRRLPARANGARPRTLAGRRIAQARFEPSPCRRASGFAWPVVKSLLQPCGFRRPPRHECGPRPHTNTPASQAARIWGSVISFAAIAKFLLDRIYRIIRIMKSPKTLAHCKNLVNPVNPV